MELEARGAPATTGIDATGPRASVIVRSFNRLDACLELLDVLLDQDYDDYEIVVVEQSTEKTPTQASRLRELAARSPRVRLLERSPLGAPGARNEGCRHASGSILLFIDDDDIPVSPQWIHQHVENFADPDVIGVSGGDILTREESLSECPYRNVARARRRNISYGFFGVPRCYPRLRERVESVGWLRGGNSSIRSAVVAEVGGWDESVVDHEEHSFAFRLRARLPGKRLVFDPRPVILRRNDLGGGLERRFSTSETTYRRWFDYFHRVYGRYHAARFIALYPLYPSLFAYETAKWVWESSRARATAGGKIVEMARVFAVSPLWFASAWVALIRSLRRGGAPRARSVLGSAPGR